MGWCKFEEKVGWSVWVEDRLLWLLEQVLSSPSCFKGPLNKKHTDHSDSNIPGNMSMHRTMWIILNSTQVECYGHHHVEGLGEIHSKESIESQGVLHIQLCLLWSLRTFMESGWHIYFSFKTVPWFLHCLWHLFCLLVKSGKWVSQRWRLILRGPECLTDAFQRYIVNTRLGRTGSDKFTITMTKIQYWLVC